MQRKLFYTFLAVTVLLFITGLGCQRDAEEVSSGNTPQSSSRSDSRLDELLGAMNLYHFEAVQKAPAFELTSVTGEKVNLRQYRGKIVLLSFWASW